MNKDVIKELLTGLRDDNKNLFVVFMGLLTGSVTVVYQIIIGSIKPVFVLIPIVGLIFALLILAWINTNRDKIDDLIDELKEVDK